MSRGLSRRLDRVEVRISVDPRLGTWDDACWIGRVFGLDPAVVISEGHRLLVRADASGVATAEEQDALLSREMRLRPTRSSAQILDSIDAHPHRLARFVSSIDVTSVDLND